MNDLKLIKIGVFVKFGEHKKTDGEISAIIIRNHLILYEVTYWKNNELKTIWLNEKDFKLTKPEKITIGFIDNDKETT